MWSTIVQMIERWLREKPRADVVVATVALREAMIACQDAYTRDKAQKERLGGANTEISAWEWQLSVTELGNTLSRINLTLGIFAPEVSRAIERYLDAEGGLPPRLALQNALDRMASAVGGSSDIAVEEIDIGVEFQQALTALDEFIRKEFKIEEVHDAASRFGRSRWFFRY